MMWPTVRVAAGASVILFSSWSSAKQTTRLQRDAKEAKASLDIEDIGVGVGGGKRGPSKMRGGSPGGSPPCKDRQLGECDQIDDKCEISGDKCVKACKDRDVKKGECETDDKCVIFGDKCEAAIEDDGPPACYEFDGTTEKECTEVGTCAWSNGDQKCNFKTKDDFCTAAGDDAPCFCFDKQGPCNKASFTTPDKKKIVCQWKGGDKKCKNKHAGQDGEYAKYDTKAEAEQAMRDAATADDWAPCSDFDGTKNDCTDAGYCAYDDGTDKCEDDLSFAEKSEESGLKRRQGEKIERSGLKRREVAHEENSAAMGEEAQDTGFPSLDHGSSRGARRR